MNINASIIDQRPTSIIKEIRQEAQDESFPETASVLVRLYELSSDDEEDLVLQITHATNSQNPVDLKDLRSNDERQKKLEMSIAELGYTYRRKRIDSSPKPTEITSGTAAEAVLAVWRESPHQAKFFTREHFGKLYDSIFEETLYGNLDISPQQLSATFRRGDLIHFLKKAQQEP